MRPNPTPGRLKASGFTRFNSILRLRKGGDLSENESNRQLQMGWPEQLLSAPPAGQLPPGYTFID